MIDDKRELDRNEKANIEKTLVDNKDTIQSIIDQLKNLDVRVSFCNRTYIDYRSSEGQRKYVLNCGGQRK